jgi:hypothetical protein
VWSDTLMENSHHLLGDLPYGVYMVTSPKGFSVLTGDPFLTGIGTWYAVDENSRPISTKLLSVGPHVYGSDGHVPVFVVFAYYDNTHVVVTNLDNRQIIWEGDLDSADYYLREGGDVPPISYSVEATRPVSTMTGGGLGGMYIPAFNGTFTGRDFMTYQQRWITGGVHDLEIVPWEDETQVTITDLDDPADTIWHEFFEKRGEIKGQAIPLSGSGRALYIHSDKDVSLPQVPWVSYSAPNSLGFFLMRGIDRDGLGIGREFYLPIEGSILPDYPSRLHVIAFEDNTEVRVGRIPRTGGAETQIWEGTLNKGEYYRYTCQADAQDHAIYHVTASEGVATIANCRDLEGSDFFPVVNLPALGISEPPVTPVPVTHSLNWQVLAAVGQQITLQYSDCPSGFQAEVFDATGRKVDELHSTERSGMIVWGECYAPGVYFIRADNKVRYTQKVILVR